MTDPNAAARHALQVLLSGGAPNGVAPESCGKWAPYIETSYELHDSGGPEVVKRYLGGVLKSKDGRALAALLAGAASAPAIDVDIPDHPPLPVSIQIDYSIGQGAGEWMDTYVEYASQVAPMSPQYWHESAALWLYSTAIARRLKVVMPFDTIYPNIFVLWLAPTTLWGKTTSLKIARRLANHTFPYLMASQDTTVESLVSDMAGCEPNNKKDMNDRALDEWRIERNYAAQRGWAVDEMSGLLASAGKEYNAGFLEALMIFYDCEDRYTRSTRAQGRIVINKSSLSLIGASTPAVMNPHLDSQRLWAMGWWPRFAILTPDRDIPPDADQNEDIAEPPSLANRLRAICEHLPPATWPDPPDARSVPLGRGVFDLWKTYSHAMRRDMLTTYSIDERLHGTYGRLPTHVIKIATLLAAMDWQRGSMPIIELPHLVRAIDIAERWRASVHRALVITSASEGSALRTRVLRQFSLYDDRGGLTLRDLSRLMRDQDVSRLEVAIQEAVKLGDLEEISSGEGKRGRPTTKYRITRG